MTYRTGALLAQVALSAVRLAVLAYAVDFEADLDPACAGPIAPRRRKVTHAARAAQVDQFR